MHLSQLAGASSFAVARRDDHDITCTLHKAMGVRVRWNCAKRHFAVWFSRRILLVPAFLNHAMYNAFVLGFLSSCKFDVIMFCSNCQSYILQSYLMHWADSVSVCVTERQTGSSCNYYALQHSSHT